MGDRVKLEERDVCEGVKLGKRDMRNIVEGGACDDVPSILDSVSLGVGTEERA